MASDLEEQKKLLLPILQRAEEIQAVEPRMAYYCRLYAIKKGLEIPHPAKEISGLIKATFAQCERDKPAVKPSEAADRVYCESFALNVFRRADKVDRAGRADINTCKAFYAAAIFLQVLEQFLEAGEDMEVAAPDLLEKTRYALWRAAEIRKALREGRQPAPPPDAGAGAGPGSSGGGDGSVEDMFAGPAYEQTAPDEAGGSGGGSSAAAAAAGAAAAAATAGAAAGPHPPHVMDSVASSTDELLALPRPPSTVPPAGSTGLLAPAAAAGPRFRPGSRVWCASAAAAGGGPPEEGTVGMVVSPSGGPGGQALYKVALADRLEELPDSQLAPAAAAGARVAFVAGHGEAPLPASVIASNVERWPVTYLLQLDNGRNLDTDGGHISQLAPGEPTARQPVAAAGPSPPPAPPLVDTRPPPQAQRPAVPGGPQPGPPPPPQQPPPAGPSSYPAAPLPAASRPLGAAAAPAPAAAAAAYELPPPSGTSGFAPSSAAIAEAQKCAKYAASSLAFDDVAGGVKYLTDALRLLTQPSGK